MESSSIHKQYLQKIYNQNIAVQDAQQTSFCYLNTLALQFLVVIFVCVSIVTALIGYFQQEDLVLNSKMNLISTLFTILTMTTIVFQKLALIEWIKQKKDYQTKPSSIIIFMIVEIILLIPTPNNFICRTLAIQSYDIQKNSIGFFVEDLLAAYVLVRCIYFIKFVIHFELYYGSRPDRLSRLYTVKFGTFNAFKFLINEKPQVILVLIFLFNYLFLPLVLFLVEGKINPALNNFTACMYYQVVTQVTVGYGDITVCTILGRAIMAISVIIGITTTSILLIFFMRLMQQDTSQQESHILLSILDKKQNLTKAMVQRLETQVSYLSKKVPVEEREQNIEKLNEFKFNNARRIRNQRQVSCNLKRMMMGNFSSILQGINQLKQTQIMLAKYVKIIQNSHYSGSKSSHTENQPHKSPLQIDL